VSNMKDVADDSALLPWVRAGHQICKSCCAAVTECLMQVYCLGVFSSSVVLFYHYALDKRSYQTKQLNSLRHFVLAVHVLACIAGVVTIVRIINRLDLTIVSQSHVAAPACSSSGKQ